MSFKDWLKKYIPNGQENKVIERAGIAPANITRWKKGVKPNTLTVIFVAKAIHLLYGHDYKEVVTTGLKAAARLI